MASETHSSPGMLCSSLPEPSIASRTLPRTSPCGLSSTGRQEERSSAVEAEFSSDGISIRRYRVTDVTLVYEGVRESISEISPWLPWCHPDYSMEDSAAWVLSRDEAWANSVELSFVITDAQTGAFLGT